jgi:hypothetical protein
MSHVNEQPSSESVRRHLEESRRLGKEMERSADAAVRHLRRAAELLRRAEGNSNRT